MHRFRSACSFLPYQKEMFNHEWEIVTHKLQLLSRTCQSTWKNALKVLGNGHIQWQTGKVHMAEILFRAQFRCHSAHCFCWQMKFWEVPWVSVGAKHDPIQGNCWGQYLSVHGVLHRISPSRTDSALPMTNTIYEVTHKRLALGGTFCVAGWQNSSLLSFAGRIVMQYIFPLELYQDQKKEIPRNSLFGAAVELLFWTWMIGKVLNVKEQKAKWIQHWSWRPLTRRAEAVAQ